jgi:hypothetical protein
MENQTSTKHNDSIESNATKKSPKNLKTEKSQSTAHGTVRKNENSQFMDGAGHVTSGPSMEDSKFLMESSIAAGSTKQQSKFIENDDHQAHKTMTNIPENHSLYHESHSMLESVTHQEQSAKVQRVMNDGSALMGIISGSGQGYFDAGFSRASKHEESVRKKSKTKQSQRVRMPMATKIIDNIIYPVQTKRGLKWGKPLPIEPKLQTVTEGSNQMGT